MNLVTYELAARLEHEKNKKRVETLQNGATQHDSESPVIEFLRLYELAHKRHRPPAVVKSMLIPSWVGKSALTDL